MLSSNKIMAFAPTRDQARAKKFYQETLGLKLLSEDNFALAFDCNGIMLRVTSVGDFTPQPFTVCGWESGDIEGDIRELTAVGVKFERFGFIEQDELGVWNAPGGSKIAWFKDPDGNTLSLAQLT